MSHDPRDLDDRRAPERRDRPDHLVRRMSRLEVLRRTTEEQNRRLSGREK